MIIGHFVFRRRWLANAHYCRVVYKDREYPSVEHAYQAQKATNRHDHDWIVRSMGAADARKRGRALPKIRSGFHSFKKRLMLKLLWSKFHHNPHLREKLLKTWPHELVNGNMRGDKYWGVDRETGKGDNILGKLLMYLRDCIREGTDHRIPEMGNKKLERHKRYRQRKRDQLEEINLGTVVPPMPKLSHEQQLHYYPCRIPRRLKRKGDKWAAMWSSLASNAHEYNVKWQAKLRYEAYGEVERLDPHRPGVNKWPKK